MVREYNSLRRVTGSTPCAPETNTYQGARLEGNRDYPPGEDGEAAIAMGSRCKPCGRKGIETDDHTRVVRRAPRLPSLGSRVYEDHGEQIAGGNALACVMGLPPEKSNPIDTF